MTAPLVSIITPTYNHARFLGRCMDSMVAQTYQHWEMVVVDDGSTDNTASIVKSYTDSRIRYFHQANRGVRHLAETMNFALRQTTGTLVTMFPSDDTWPPYRLEKQVPVFEDPSVVLCHGAGLLIDENDKVIGRIRPPAAVQRIKNRPVGSALRQLLVSNFVFEPSELLRREALEKIGGYLQPPGLLGEDYPTHLALARVGEFRYLDVPLANYRMHGSQMTRTHRLEMAKTDVAYAMEVFRSLDAPTQNLVGWTDESLSRALLVKLHNAYFEEGRRMLLRGARRDARREFLTALVKGAAATKAKALVGLLCTTLHIDLERVVALAGRPRLG